MTGRSIRPGCKQMIRKIIGMSRVAVIILNWNGEKLLKEFLPSVVRNTDSRFGAGSCGGQCFGRCFCRDHGT